ncbi:MAG: hypothetical protein WAT71_07690 [Ignavibacteria bacterium]
MNCLLISYDLGSPESSSDYQNVIKYIKSLGKYTKPLYSVFLVVTNKSEVNVVDELIELTDNNDRILVINITSNDWATAGLNKSVNDWMNDNI